MSEGGRTGARSGRPGLVVAIDGPVGAGKSTVARRLAEALGCVHIDSGAMYRAVGWKAVQTGVDLRDHAGLAALAARTDVRIVPTATGPRVLVDGTDVTGWLRTPAMDEAASLVSTCPAVRERLVALQRAMACAGGVVMDGRDIGTVVFPDADLKFFLDADLGVRADRRLQDLRRAGGPSTRAPSARRFRAATPVTAVARLRRFARPPTRSGSTRRRWMRTGSCAGCWTRWPACANGISRC